MVAGINTIACEECNDWFHFSCVDLTKDNVDKIDKQTDYVCKQCIENQLYQLPNAENFQPDEPKLDELQTGTEPGNMSDTGEDSQTLILSQEEPTMVKEIQQSASQSARIFPSYTGRPKSTEHKTENYHEEAPNEIIYVQTDNICTTPKRPCELKPTKKSEASQKQKSKSHDTLQRSHIIELEQKLQDRDRTIQLMEDRLSQLEQKNHVVTQQCSTTIHDNIETNNTSNCQIQHIMNNIRALEHQLTQHMCINTALTTQMAMQLQQSMFVRQMAPIPGYFNANTSIQPTGSHVPHYTEYHSNQEYYGHHQYQNAPHNHLLHQSQTELYTRYSQPDYLQNKPYHSPLNDRVYQQQHITPQNC